MRRLDGKRGNWYLKVPARVDDLKDTTAVLESDARSAVNSWPLAPELNSLCAMAFVIVSIHSENTTETLGFSRHSCSHA